MSIIIDDGSKESKENFALAKAIQSKIKLGKNAGTILGWLIGEPYKKEKEEPPDFILKGASGVVGIEHFQVTAGSVIKKGASYSLPDEISSAKNKGKHYAHEKTEKTLKQALRASVYPSSILAFKKNLRNI